MLQIFVYGTLQPGESNDWVYADALVAARPAIVLGRLYHLPLGYPTLTAGSQTVRGFLLCFSDPNLLQRLDEFEQHDPIALQNYLLDRLGALDCTVPHDQMSFRQYDYERQEIEVLDLDRRSLGKAWVYQMTIEQTQKLGGSPLSVEQWSSRQAYLKK